MLIPKEELNIENNSEVKSVVLLQKVIILILVNMD